MKTIFNYRSGFSALSLLLFTLLIGCARKQSSVSSYELQRERSLELENYNAGRGPVTDELTAEAGIGEATPVIPSDDKVQKETPSIVGTPYAPKTYKESKTQAKIEKLKKSINKKTTKLKQGIAKGNGMNYNVRIGLILILVGALIAIVLGSVFSSSVFYSIGTIVAVIGIVFLILGLLQA